MLDAPTLLVDLVSLVGVFQLELLELLVRTWLRQRKDLWSSGQEANEEGVRMREEEDGHFHGGELLRAEVEK